jgi:8-oxo-dGTP diphosphatase
MPGDLVQAVGAVVVRAAPHAAGADWQVLLIRRGRPPNEGTWTLPGGHVEAGESWAAAVAREVLEETGLVVDVVAFTETFELHAQRSYAIHEHLCVPRGPADATAALRPGDDAAEAIWATAEDFALRRVSKEAQGVIVRAVAMARDKKVL